MEMHFKISIFTQEFKMGVFHRKIVLFDFEGSFKLRIPF